MLKKLICKVSSEDPNKNDQNVMYSFKQSTDFIAIEPTRKYIEERQILVTTTKKLYNARIKADKSYLDLNIDKQC